MSEQTPTDKTALSLNRKIAERINISVREKLFSAAHKNDDKYAKLINDTINAIVKDIDPELELDTPAKFNLEGQARDFIQKVYRESERALKEKHMEEVANRATQGIYSDR